ncbi:L-histidine N(alpha)-methyltransferase [Streptomyces sp. NPDC001414]
MSPLRRPVPMTTPTRTTDPVQLAALRGDVVRGLTAERKTLPPKWLYDADGSDLFQEITLLPEYYATRTEHSLLGDVAGEIAAATCARTLIELGAGASDKAAALLGALAGTVTTYQPVDISAHALALAASSLTDAHPGLSVRPLVADISAPLDLPEADDGPWLIAFLGGTLGNLLPAERAEFLGGLSAQLEPEDRLLLGVQLVTDPARMLAAYDDAAGVTAQFSRGVLHRINRELGADFDPDAFEHVAYWDAENQWIEMRLRAREAQTVTVADPGIRVHFAAGEDLRTEVSAKFTLDGLAKELTAVGLDLAVVWSDPSHLVALVLAAPSTSLPVS